jgi:amidohydrolase
MSKTAFDFDQEVKKRQESLISLRRDFHQNPELSFKEERTAGIIAERLRAAGLELRTGLAGTGVVGVLHGEKPGRTIAWRADIDALPIQEEVALPFASKTPGVMHACGHDGHTAIAVHLAETLAAHRRDLPGTAVFIFQPAEEVLGGATRMIAEGALENPHVERVYGLHLTTQTPTGHLTVHPGPAMASADFFSVDIKGKGGHGAYPHFSIDPITAAANIIIGMQNLVSREIAAQDTAVLTIGQLEAGTKNNIIPETAVMRGTLRTFRAEVRDQLVERLSGFASRIAQAYRAEAQMHLDMAGCPAVDNGQEEAAFVHRCAAEAVGADKVSDGIAVMASDDVAVFIKERGGCYFRVGIAPDGKEAYPHHNPKFEMNEKGLAVGMRVGLNVMLQALAGNTGS